jgi:hypothetical protein
VEDLVEFTKLSDAKQSQIIIACMAIHNFIRENALPDVEFDRCDHDENYMPEVKDA